MSNSSELDDDSLSPEEDSSPEDDTVEDESSEVDNGESSPTEESDSDDEELTLSSDDEDEEESQHEVFLPPPEEDHVMFQPVRRNKLDLTVFGLSYIDSMIRLIGLVVSLVMGIGIIFACTVCITDVQTQDYAKSDEGGRDCYMWTICVRTRFLSYCHFGFVVEFALELAFNIAKVYVKWCQYDNPRFLRKFKMAFVPIQLFFHFIYMSFFVANLAFTTIASPIQWRCHRGMNSIVERYLPWMSIIIVMQYVMTLFQMFLFCYSIVLFFVILFATFTSLVVNVEFHFEDEFKLEVDNLSEDDSDSWKWKGR